MKRPGVVLLLVITAVAAVQYQLQSTVSLPSLEVQTISTVSKVACAFRCNTLPPEECSGFTYEPGDGTCRLFSGDCRGPAASSSPPTTDRRYLGRSHCPGTPPNSCGCPVNFSRCAGRCLTRLDQKVTYTEAERLCAELGAHLAVPRTEEENQCALTAAVDAELVWLGITDVVTEDQFVGADGCGAMSSEDPAWADNQPNNINNQDFVNLVKSPDARISGWSDVHSTDELSPLCQMTLCYRPGCP